MKTYIAQMADWPVVQEATETDAQGGDAQGGDIRT